MPVPDLGSTAAFAALIDAESGGCVELTPEEPAEVSRAYIPDTNVLVTTFTTESGTVRVTDALVTGIAGRLPWAELARRVEGVDGEVRMRWAVRPAPVSAASPRGSRTPTAARSSARATSPSASPARNTGRTARKRPPVPATS